MLSPDLVCCFVVLDVAVILVVAHTLGGMARRLGQPHVTGEIVAGVLLGPTLLGPAVFVWGQPWGFLHCRAAITATQSAGTPSITACLFPPQARSVLGILGQVALMLFLFLVGLELDLDLLKGKGRAIAIIGPGVVGVSMALGLLIGPLLYDETFVGGFGTPVQPSKLSFALTVGAMLSATAFPITARILQEKQLIRSPMGSFAVAAAATATVFVFLGAAAAADVATGRSARHFAITLALTGVYLAGLFLVARPALAILGRAYEAKGKLTPDVFATILILLAASAYIADRIGINVILGSFLAGVIMPARKGLFRDIASRLGNPTTFVLLPVFLAVSGLRTDFTTLRAASLPGVALFVAAGVVGHWPGGTLLARLGGLSWAEGNVLGVLLNCRGLLVLVIALVALDEHVITGAMQASAVLMALVTTAMTGPLVDAFLPRVAATTARSGT